MRGNVPWLGTAFSHTDVGSTGKVLWVGTGSQVMMGRTIMGAPSRTSLHALLLYIHMQ